MTVGQPWLTLCFVCLFVSIATTFAQRDYEDLYEGSSCFLKTTKAPGTCRLVTDCPSQLSLLKTRRQFRPQICSFQGSNAIICCENSPPTSASSSAPVVSATTPKPTPGTPNNTAVVNRIIAGDKSKKACEEYSNEVPRQVIPLILDGVPTTEGEFPHMAVLGYVAEGQSETTWNCAGALISDRYVVTAAHCFGDRILKTPKRVRLGEYDLKETKDHAEDYGIEKFIVHPEYTARSWYHDLALIRLNRKVKFTSYIHPGCLWVKPEDPQNGLIITGWGGTTMDSGVKSDILLKGNRTLVRVAPESCGKFYRQAGNRIKDGIKAGMLCAVDPVGNSDTCKGDSGGPIQVTTGHRPGVGYFVLGVTSGGPSLCGGKTPTIYTRLYNYLDWIESVVWP